MGNPRVSVIIPMYNSRRTITRALRSVIHQTFEDFELIVVDDGSTDGSASIVRTVPDPRIRLVETRNAGPGPARNTGIGLAQAELLAFLDADDEWQPDYLDRGVRTLTEYPVVAAFSQGYFQLNREYEGPASTRPLWEKRGLYSGHHRISGESDAQFVVHLLAYMSPWSTLARKPVVLRYGGFFDGYRCVYAEDAYLWLKILLNETVAISLEPRVIHHAEASTLTNTLAQPHAIEPFLVDPGPIEAACPPSKRRLLREVLAIRAMKTALYYAVYGRGQVARQLLRRYRIPGFLTTQMRTVWLLTWLAPITPGGIFWYRLARSLRA